MASEYYWRIVVDHDKPSVKAEHFVKHDDDAPVRFEYLHVKLVDRKKGGKAIVVRMTDDDGELINAVKYVD